MNKEKIWFIDVTLQFVLFITAIILHNQTLIMVTGFMLLFGLINEWGYILQEKITKNSSTSITENDKDKEDNEHES